MKKVLVIDDEQYVLGVMKLNLEKEGYEVSVARDGQEGIDLFDGEDFDLVITDILMPRKNGIKTIQHIRNSGRNVPILAISGAGASGAMNYLSMAEMVGADRTLAKPFERMAFMGSVNDCLALQAA